MQGARAVVESTLQLGEAQLRWPAHALHATASTPFSMLTVAWKTEAHKPANAGVKNAERG